VTVYQDGYYCHVCNKTVTAKIWWSNDENDLIASCTECGTELQRVIPAPASKLTWPKGYLETFSTPLAGGELGLLNKSRVSADNPRAAPAPHQEDTA